MAESDRSRRAALSRILRDQVARDRTVVEQLGRPVALLTSAPDAVERDTLISLLARVCDRLPGLFVAGELSEEGGTIVQLLTLSAEEQDEFGVAGLGAAAYRDDSGSVWVAVSGVYFFPGIIAGDGFSADAAFELVNHLNDSCPVGAWGMFDGAVALANGVTRRAGDGYESSWLDLAASIVWDTAAYGSACSRSLHEGAPLEGHPAYLLRKQEEMFLVASSREFTVSDVADAADSYLLSLPRQISEVIEVVRAQQTLRLYLPFPREDGESFFVVKIRVSAEAPTPLIPGGVVFYAEIPGLFSRDEADRWCERLNGFSDDDSSPEAVTTPWQLGNWYHTPDDGLGDARTLSFYGVVPHHMRGLVDLRAVIDGIVREIWSSYDRVAFARHFCDILMHDVAEVADCPEALVPPPADPRVRRAPDVNDKLGNDKLGVDGEEG